MHADILSARCIVDRLRLQSGPAAVAESADRMEFRKISSNLAVIVKFVRSVEDVLDPEAAIENGEPS